MLQRQICKDGGCDGVIDIQTALGGTQNYEAAALSCDGCHPKDAALTIIAAEIAKTIRASKSDDDVGP